MVISSFMDVEVYRFEYEVSVQFYAVVAIMALSVLAKMVRESDHGSFPEETVQAYIQECLATKRQSKQDTDSKTEEISISDPKKSD